MFGVSKALLQEVPERVHHGLLATPVRAGQRGVAIGSWVALPRRQATVALTRNCGGVRVNLVEIIQNRANGDMQAVEIEPVKRYPLVLGRRIMPTQPIDEVTHLIVAPYPGRETRKCRPFGGRVFEMPYVVVDARGIRPVTLDGDEAEPLFYNQFPRIR